MIKRILKIWFIIAVYELSKYITNELIVMLQSEDDIDTAPKDFALETDQYDLNRIEVSEHVDNINHYTRHTSTHSNR